MNIRKRRFASLALATFIGTIAFVTSAHFAKAAGCGWSGGCWRYEIDDKGTVHSYDCGGSAYVQPPGTATGTKKSTGQNCGFQCYEPSVTSCTE